MGKYFLLGFLIFLGIGSFTSKAQDFNIHFTLRSYHLDRDRDFREWNIGFGMGYNFGPGIVEVGWYLNSEDNVSFYTGLTKEYPEDAYVGIGGSLGIVTGYDNEPVDLSPFISPGGFLGKIPRFRVAFIPHNGGVFASQVKVNLTELSKEVN